MLPEQERLVYKNFVELVANCNLVRVMKGISSKDPTVNKVMANINVEEDYRHNNRLILFNLLKVKSETFFYLFVDSLRECKYYDLANKLDKKSVDTTPNSGYNRQSMLRFIMNLLIIIFMKIVPAMM